MNSALPQPSNHLNNQTMNTGISLLGRCLPCVLIAVLGLAVASKSLGATVIYNEQFDNSTGSSAAVNTVGWSSYLGSTASNISTQVNATVISSVAGNPTADGNGYFGFIGTGTFPAHTGTLAFVTTFSTLDISGSTITWTMANGSTAPVIQLLIQVNGNWYVSNQTFSNSTTYASISTPPTATILQTLTFSTQASDWSAFTLTPWSSMSVGSVLSSDLSSSAITGIGFYLSNAADATVRLDSLTVTVPEPGTTALLGVCLVMLGARTIKRTRA